MAAAIFEVTGRNKPFPPALSSISDFGLRLAGSIEEDRLLSSPDWSLYCLDYCSRQALLVELPEGCDVSLAPFVYTEQYTKARRVVLLPFDQLIATSSRLQQPSQLAFLFSTGRCGSTLASRILAKLPEVWSLSEPDCYTNIAVERMDLAREEGAELLRAATLWTCRPPRGRNPEAIVIKPRSEVALIAEVCHLAHPHMHSVFMYRDHPGYTNSVFKFAQRAQGQEAFFSAPESWRSLWPFLMVGTPISQLNEWFAPDHGQVHWEEFATLMWILRIEGYLGALRRGLKFTAIHYTDLNRDREKETARLLSGCGLSSRHVEMALTGFGEDSHTGSIGANTTAARSLNVEERARAKTLLEKLGRPDYVETRLPEARPAAPSRSRLQ